MVARRCPTYSGNSKALTEPSVETWLNHINQIPRNPNGNLLKFALRAYEII